MNDTPENETPENEAPEDAAPEEEAATEDGELSDDDDERMAAEWAAMAEGDVEDSGGEDRGGRPDRVLNQDEIDNLLGFEDDEGSGRDKKGLQAILNSALVSYERLPMLEVVYDRLVRLMSTSLRNFTSDNVEVSLDSITSVRFGDYLNSIPLPAMLSVFRAEEWDNHGLLTVDSSLIYSIVDVLLGGRRGSTPMRVEGRPYTTIERTLVERMVQLVLSDLSAAFEPLSPVTFRFERLDTNPRFATIARPANAAIVARLRVDMEDRGGRVELLLPYATLEPIRELLLQMFMGEKFGRDSIWENHLASQLWRTDVDVTVVLDRQYMQLGNVLDLKVGSQLMLNATKSSQVNLNCGDMCLFRGQVGRSGQYLAVRIHEKMDEENELQ